MTVFYSIIDIIFLGIIFFSIVDFISVFLFIDSITNVQTNVTIVYLIMVIEFTFFVSLFFFILNRFGCKILYNANEGVIIRKGFICGYEYQLKIEDIKEVIIATFPKETTYYVIVDLYNTKYDGGSKKSFIRIEKNENNLKFIKQFWEKPIKNN